MTIEELQVRAYQVAAEPTLRRRPVKLNEAIFRYWIENKDVGPLATQEFALDDGTRAVITLTGKILHWTGGDTVEVL